MRETFQNEIAHPQLGGNQFHFEMFLRFIEEHIWCTPKLLDRLTCEFEVKTTKE